MILQARGNPSRHCNETLLKPLQPPPITKRTLHVLANGLTNEWLKVLITTYACVVTAILVAVHFKPYDFLRRKPVISLARKTPRILNDSISEASHSFDSSKLLDGQKKHPNRSAIKGWPAQVSKVYKEIIDLQDGALGAHITLCQSKELVKLKLQHMRESLSEVRLLLSSTSDSSSSSSSSKARDAWRTKCDQFSTDGVALEHHLHALDTQEAKLMLLLYTLAKKQPDLLRTLDDYFRIRREVQDTVFGASAPSSTIEPLLQEYYDKRGNMSILREQLQDLRLDIEEESCAVEHFGREESLRKNSLPELWQKYQARLKKLQAAPFELKQTWLACQDAGLDVGGLGPEVALAPDEFSAPLSLSAQPFVPSS